MSMKVHLLIKCDNAFSVALDNLETKMWTSGLLHIFRSSSNSLFPVFFITDSIKKLNNYALNLLQMCTKLIVSIRCFCDGHPYFYSELGC